MLRRLFVLILLASIGYGCTESPKIEGASDGPPSAESIIDRAIVAHGGDAFEHVEIDFTFRGRQFLVRRDRGMFTFTRTYADSSGQIVEVMSNEGFVRTADGAPYEMTEREYNIWTEDVNSVIYFALLPYKLNDAAVQKRYLAKYTIENEPYHGIEVTFEQEGGGRDYDDRFVFWFHVDRGTMDYLAYHYTQRGTSRFRKAVNIRTIGGIRFADYLNFRADSIGMPVELAADAFNAGSLALLSEILTEEIEVRIID